MKLPSRLLLTVLVSAIAFPATSFAAKGDRKKKTETAAPTFSAMDKDGDGVVTQGEYVAAHEAIAKTQFASKDKDGDGKLSKEEFDTEAPETPKRRKKNK